MKDIIFLNQLQVKTLIGLFPFERHLKQTLILDIELETDLSVSGDNDQIENTISYAEVADFISQFSDAAQYQLLEAFAHQLIQALFDKFPAQAIKLKIQKPGAIKQTQHVGIIIKRERAD